MSKKKYEPVIEADNRIYIARDDIIAILDAVDATNYYGNGKPIRLMKGGYIPQRVLRHASGHADILAIKEGIGVLVRKKKDFSIRRFRRELLTEIENTIEKLAKKVIKLEKGDG